MLDSEEVLKLSAEEWAKRFCDEPSLESARGGATLGLMFIKNHEMAGAPEEDIKRATVALLAGLAVAERKFGGQPQEPKRQAGFNVILFAFIGALLVGVGAGYRYLKGPSEPVKGPDGTATAGGPADVPAGEAAPLPTIVEPPEVREKLDIEAEGNRRVGEYWISKFSECVEGGIRDASTPSYAMLSENVRSPQPGDLLYIEVINFNASAEGASVDPALKEKIWASYPFLQGKIREYRKGKGGKPDGWSDDLPPEWESSEEWSRKGPLVKYQEGGWTETGEAPLNKQIARVECSAIKKLDMRSALQRDADKQAEIYWKGQLSECAPGRFFLEFKDAEWLSGKAFEEALEPTFRAHPAPVSETDRLNGIEWSGIAEVSAKGFGIFRERRWGDYQSHPSHMGGPFLQKRKGRWLVFSGWGGNDTEGQPPEKADFGTSRPANCADIAATGRLR